MQAIIVKYIGPTNTKPARLKATAAAGSVTVSYPYGVSQYQVHRVAAQALCDKFNWNTSNLIEGTLPNGDAVFVFMPV